MIKKWLYWLFGARHVVVVGCRNEQSDVILYSKEYVLPFNALNRCKQIEEMDDVERIESFGELPDFIEIRKYTESWGD